MMIFCVNSYTQESRFRVKTTLPKTNIALGLPSPKRNPNPFPLPRFFRCKTMWFLASVSVTILVEFWRRFIPQNSPSLRRDSSKKHLGVIFFPFVGRWSPGRRLLSKMDWHATAASCEMRLRDDSDEVIWKKPSGGGECRGGRVDIIRVVSLMFMKFMILWYFM